jgi:uncharacterized protein YbjT (DUF2867 family)
MKILLTGATGYIGKRLLPVLIENGHEVICCVRDRRRLKLTKEIKEKVSIYETDFSDAEGFHDAPVDYDVAYYLIHSLASSIGKFSDQEATAAKNFVRLVNRSSARQIIYLTGIVNEQNLSVHLQSRKNVENILRTSDVPMTVLRAAIIVGSGSASFEIIRDLVEKLPVMIAPKWLKTRVQPIGIRDVIRYLTGVALREETFKNVYDIGGSEILTYKQMLLKYAKVRGLRRIIIVLPVLTPRLSSYWLYFITSISYKLAVNLVESMKVEVICKNKELDKILNIQPDDYEETVRKAFRRIEENMVISSWKDSFVSSSAQKHLMGFIQVPEKGVMRDFQKKEITGNVERVKKKLWSVGGNNGWFYATFLWRIRGIADKLYGGVGLRRGRTSSSDLHPGDALDFWRVLVADYEEGRLLLYAEMKLPGEAWLEWKFVESSGKTFLNQTATFRPSGLTGRLYWYSMLPAHFFIFEGMLNAITDVKTE